MAGPAGASAEFDEPAPFEDAVDEALGFGVVLDLAVEAAPCGQEGGQVE